jgi:hypothetical protein
LSADPTADDSLLADYDCSSSESVGQ